MSSNNNSDHSGIAIAFAVIGGGMLILGALIYAALLFGAFVMTLLCLCALDEDLTAGRYVLPRDEARAFLARGVFGAIALPVFVLFCSALFGFRLADGMLIHVCLGGYALFSLGAVLLDVSNGNDAAVPVRQLPPPAPPAPSQGFILIAKPDAVPPQPAPFRFARWDDEEEAQR